MKLSKGQSGILAQFFINMAVAWLVATFLTTQTFDILEKIKGIGEAIICLLLALIFSKKS